MPLGKFNGRTSKFDHRTRRARLYKQAKATFEAALGGPLSYYDAIHLDRAAHLVAEIAGMSATTAGGDPFEQQRFDVACAELGSLIDMLGVAPSLAENLIRTNSEKRAAA